MKRMHDDKIINQALSDIDALKDGYTSNDASTKKIYIHPVIIISNVDNAGFAMFIFDDNPEPYDTWTKVKTKLFSIATAINDTARVPVTGSFLGDSNEIIARNLDVKTNNTIIAFGRNINGVAASKDITEYNFTDVFDGVNPIN